MIRRSFSLFFTVLLIITLAIPQTNAYSLFGHKITSSITLVPYSGYGTLSKTHMAYAASKWNAQVTGSTPLIISSGTHSSTSGFPTQDGNNYIYRIDAGAGYVGLAGLYCTSGELTECDINLNMYYSWANSAQPNCYDVYSLILHELGHAMGLMDLSSSSYNYYTAVMWYQAYTNSTKRSLLADDINGIAAIY